MAIPAEISYWKLDETSGTTLVDSTGSNNGTLAGSSSLGQSPVFDDGGTSVAFTGGYANLPFTGNTLPATINFWMANPPLSGNYQGIIGCDNTQAVLYSHTGKLFLYISAGLNDLTDIVLDNDPHMVTMVFKGTGAVGDDYRVEVYYDGVYVTERNLQANINLNSFYLAANFAGSETGDVTLDEIKAWDVALTSSQVAELFSGIGSTSSISIGVSSTNQFAETVHIKPVDAISATNLSSTWEG